MNPLPPSGAAGKSPAEIWDAVQGHLHEIVNIARDLERHLDGAAGARVNELRRLAEEVVAYLRPEH